MGNVFWTAASLCNFKEWWLNDILTMPFFEAVKAIGDTIEVSERTKEEYYKLREAAEKMKDPRAIALEPYYTFSGGGYRTGGPGWSAKSQTAATYQNKMRQCWEILHRTNVKLTALDWTAMNLDSLSDNDFVYLDPPYKDCDVRAYANDTLNHEEMVEVLRGAKFKWLLSEYAHPLYLETFGDPFYKKDTQLVVKDRKKHAEERRIECLWKNY
jgi:site-specific DNA-adenine methylase